MRLLFVRFIPHQPQGTPPTEFQFSQDDVWFLPFGNGVRLFLLGLSEHPFGEIANDLEIGGGRDQSGRSYRLATVEGYEACQSLSLHSGL